MLRHFLSCFLLFSLFSLPCSNVYADQNSEVDNVILDAMKKAYELDKMEKTKEKLTENARRLRTSFSPAETARLIKVCGTSTDFNFDKPNQPPPKQAAIVSEAKALLDAGADPNGREPTTGSTPLIKATSFGNIELMKLLLKHGAHVNAADNDGNTAMLTAAYNKDAEALALLLDSGGDIHAVNNLGESALVAATAMESDDDITTKFISPLLQRGANPNVICKNGVTALMGAAVAGNEKAAIMLLDHGADINIAAKDGATALMMAAMDGVPNTTRLLLKHGAIQRNGFGGPFTVLPSKQDWLLLFGQFPDMGKITAVLRIYAPLIKGEPMPLTAWGLFNGGKPERLKWTPMQAEKGCGGEFADPVGFMRRLLKADHFVLRIDFKDGQSVFSEFPLAEAKSVLAATLAVAERERRIR